MGKSQVCDEDFCTLLVSENSESEGNTLYSLELRRRKEYVKSREGWLPEPPPVISIILSVSDEMEGFMTKVELLKMGRVKF